MGKKLLSATGHKLDFQGQLIDRNQDLFLHGNNRYFGGTGGKRTLAAKTGYLLEGNEQYENYLTDGTKTNIGVIFVFNDSGTFLGKIENPSQASGDQFGYSLRFRLDGDRLIVGAYTADPLSGTNQGIAYLYDTSDSNWENWTLLNAYQMPNYYSSTTGDQLNAVAVSDDYVIAAHRAEDNSSYSSIGVVHIFNANSPYQYVRTIQNPNAASSDQFGFDVDIYGSTAIIGAPYDDQHTTNAGRAYLYNVSTGSQIANLFNYEYNSLTSSGYFGYSVAMNGNRVVVGAYRQGDYYYGNRDRVGFLYVYDHNGNYFTQIEPTNTAYSYLGYTVDISIGGVIVFGNSASNGRIYAYNTNGSSLTNKSNPNINTKTSSDSFGRNVAIQRDTFSTSNYKWYAAAPYEDRVDAIDRGVIYHYTGSSYNGYFGPPEDGILGNDSYENDPRLGYTVAVNDRYAAAGAYQAYDWESDSSNTLYSYSGIVNVYDARNNFQKIRTVRNFNIYSTKNSDYFGRAVELQKDGDLLAILAEGEDSALYGGLSVVYVYDIATDTLQRAIQNPNPDTSYASDRFGLGISSDGAMAIDDTYIAIGAQYEEYNSNANAGRVYIYNHINGLNPLNLTSPNYQVSGYFGVSVNMHGDIIAVGASREGSTYNGSGRVYIYNRSTGSLLATIENPNPSTYDYYGNMVKISPNGNYMAVGAYNEDFNTSGSGSVYLYDISNPSSPVELWRRDATEANEYSGYNIGLSDYHVVSGAHGYDGVATDSGRAFVYDIDGNLLETLYPTNPYNLQVDTYNNYGFSVAVNNNANVVVGEQAARKTQLEDDFGAVYFYR